MVPPNTHPAWAKLIKGEMKHQFSQPSASMLVHNLQRDYQRSPAGLSAQIEQARAFFERHERSLAGDMRVLFR